MIEKEVLPEQEFVRQEFEKFGLHPEIQIVSIEPADAEIQRAVRLAQNSDLTILFCFDAHLYPSNKRLLEALRDAAQSWWLTCCATLMTRPISRKGLPA